MSKKNQNSLEKKPMAKKPAKQGKTAVNTADGFVNILGLKIPENRLAVVITAAILVVILIASAIIFTVDFIVNDRGFNYMKSNLSSYLSISEDDYKNFTLEVNVAEPREVDFQGSILGLIASNKGDAIEGPGEYVTSGVAITAGSLVKIWYRGYIIGKDGEEIEMDGLSNYSEAGAAELEVGSLYFPAGFELGLVDYYLDRNRTRFEKFTEGQITDDMVVYVDYTKTQTSSGTKNESKNVRLDLSEDLDADYGQGFKDHILSMSLGAEKEFGITDSKGTHHTYKLKASFATKCENASDVLKVDSYFPYNTSNASLRNQDVRFDVFVESVRRFEIDEFNDDFVKEIVERKESKLTFEVLDAYEGETLTEKYEAYIRDELNRTYKKLYDKAVKDALWNHLRGKADIKKYPKAEVDSFYNSELSDLQRQFDVNEGKLWNSSLGQYSTYQTLDAYAVAYYGFTKTAEYPTWRDFIYGMSKLVVAEKMIMYYIMDKADLAPTDAELDAATEAVKQRTLKEYIDQYLQNEGKTEKHFTKEEYAAFVAEREAEINDYYDDEYFKDMAYDEIFIERILVGVTVSTLDDRSNLPEIM